MEFVLSVHIPDGAPRQGVEIAQALREVAATVETQSPLVPGELNDRLTGDHRAHWETWGFVPITPPIIETFGPDPAPVGTDGVEVGFNLTGSGFMEGMQLYIDGNPVNHTDIYSAWTVTGGMDKQPTGRDCQAALMYDGILYASFVWQFRDVVEPPAEPPAPDRGPVKKR